MVKNTGVAVATTRLFSAVIEQKKEHKWLICLFTIPPHPKVPAPTVVIAGRLGSLGVLVNRSQEE